MGSKEDDKRYDRIIAKKVLKSTFSVKFAQSVEWLSLNDHLGHIGRLLLWTVEYLLSGMLVMFRTI